MSRAWPDVEVKALISIWGEQKVQEELDGAVRNKQFFWYTKENSRTGI